MRHLWRIARVEPLYFYLQDAVRIRYALALALMLQLGFHEEGFQKSALLGSILEHAPGICAVAATLMRKPF